MQDFLEALIPASFALIVLLLLIGLVAFFFSAKKTKQQKAHFEKLHQDLATGKSIMFCGGIFGTVKALRKDEVDVEIAPNTTITISRYAIQTIVEKGA